MKTNEHGNPIVTVCGETITLDRLTLVEGSPDPLPSQARCAVRTGSLAGMSVAEATDALWDALRLQCCSTGLSAHRIVLLHKHDIAAALKRLTPENDRDVERRGQ